jgi:predicted CopG family antitoxin
MPTTIQVSNEVRNRLQKMKLFEQESYSLIIERMIEDTLELNAQTKKEIEEARKRVKQGKFVSMAEVSKRYGV